MTQDWRTRFCAFTKKSILIRSARHCKKSVALANVPRSTGFGIGPHLRRYSVFVSSSILSLRFMFCCVAVGSEPRQFPGAFQLNSFRLRLDTTNLLSSPISPQRPDVLRSLLDLDSPSPFCFSRVSGQFSALPLKQKSSLQ